MLVPDQGTIRRSSPATEIPRHRGIRTVVRIQYDPHDGKRAIQVRCRGYFKPKNMLQSLDIAASGVTRNIHRSDSLFAFLGGECLIDPTLEYPQKRLKRGRTIVEPIEQDIEPTKGVLVELAHSFVAQKIRRLWMDKL